jgi:hypothetical protein
MATKPIYKYEKEENKRNRNEIIRGEAELKNLLRGIEKAEKSGDTEEIIRLKAQYMEIDENRTKLLRLIADDVTSEALATLLYKNDGVMTIISTEGGLFDTLAGRYSKTINIDAILKAHCGDQIRTDRVLRESELIDRPTLTMILSAQM